jgi:hypothetical protein
MRQLYRLFYYSRQTPDSRIDLDNVVRELVNVSIRNNKDDGVTGILVALQDVFIQALEGPVDSVRNTYARISRDRRHWDLKIIAQGPVASRLFNDWNMCARTLSPSDQAILQVLDSKGAFNPAALTPQGIERLLTTVADIQRRTALKDLVIAKRA